MLTERLREELDRRQEAGLRRQRRVVETPCGTQVNIHGKPVLAFASNDYLGLAHHPEITEALCQGARTWGNGSGASHLVSGHLQPHESLEQDLAKFLGFPRAITLSTGYLANLAMVPALAGRGDVVFADKLNHASLIDAVQLSRADSHRYPHGDAKALEKLLNSSSRGRTKVIVTDAVFSMDGDLAPLADLFQLAEAHDAWLVVDDAHGFGVLGPQGQGSLAHLGIPYHPRILLMGTLGKAAGVSGAFIAGSETAIEWLIQTARSYIFTTAAPPALACALSKSLAIIEGDASRRAHLHHLIGLLQAHCQELPWHLLPSQSAIQPLIIGDNQAAVDLSLSLLEQGIWVPAIRPPTVPQGTARLRISLSAAHTEQDILRLIAALKKSRP